MNYNNQYQGGYGQQYPQGGYGGHPYPQHGGQFRAQQGGYMGRPQPSGEHDSVMEFFRSVAYGQRPCPEELKQVVLGIMSEQANGMLAQYGYTQTGSGSHEDMHARYKATLEELRDIPNILEAEKRFDAHFNDLTPEERKVLKAIVNRPSIKKLAQTVGLTPERFTEIKHQLQYKLK